MRNSFYFLIVIAIILLAGTAQAASITCGDCHSIPPADSDSEGCLRLTAKNHNAHSSGADTSTCNRCHPDPGSIHAPSNYHMNEMVNVTSLPGLGMAYNSAASTCTNACHRNQSTATWGGSLDCNACHYRSGAAGNYMMSGQHMTPDRSWRHYSSTIKVTDNTQTITCANCHPVSGTDNVAPRTHINAASFQQKGDMTNAHSDVSVTVGIVKGATAAGSTCTASCHANTDDTFGNMTVYMKPGQKLHLGAYQSSSWGQEDLRCNECHSLPSQEASFTGNTSVFGNKHHQAHMFKYKLDQERFPGTERDIYCYDCHRYPDPAGTRSFHNHSTYGQGGSGKISFPVKSENASVNLTWRNNNIGKDGINPPAFNKPDTTCSNIYCHTALTSASWKDKGCSECHGVMDGVLPGSGAPGYRNWTTPETYSAFREYPGGGGGHYIHVNSHAYGCRVCHNNGGKDGNEANHNQGGGMVIRDNVNVEVRPEYWMRGTTAAYNTANRTCTNVNCHYGQSKNWDCEPLH